MTSKLIRGHEVTASCQPWQAPEVSGPTLRGRGGAIDDLSVARQKAWQEGFAEGRAAGLEAARKDAAARAAALEKALDALSRPFEELDHRFHDEILELVRALARQLLRREMRLDPAHVVGVVREGLAALPMAATAIVVRMHPEDAATVRECLPPEDGERHWRIEADPLMERGGCVIVTAQSQVDGQMETRIGRAIATMFEEERRDHGDAPGPEPGQ
jgi:flagellar assembly protein FliH